MRWTHFTLAAALSFSVTSAKHVLNVESNIDVDGPRLPSPELVHASPQRTQHQNETALNHIARFLFPRQNVGRCGAEFGGQRCSDNQCCSSYGWCGTAFEHCAALVGCQPQYGRCGEAPVETPTPTPTPTPSPSSSTVISSSTVSPPLPSGTLIVSTNGLCGNSTTCAGSAFGNCCSEWYWCGAGLDYCGTGCRTGFGTCGNAPPISSSSSVSVPPTQTPTPTSSTPVTSSSSTQAPTPTSTVPVSTDGRCGNGIGCIGSMFGRCCSSYGWCGNQDDYCRPAYGCQPEWGECGPGPQN